MIGTNSSGGGLVPLAIGDYVSDGIVIYVDPIINTTGIIIALNDYGSYPLAFNNDYFSQDTPRGIWDATAATNQIISEFSGSTNHAAGRVRSYLDGTWDFANRSMYGLFHSNKTIIQNAISAAGGTQLTDVKHNCSDIYLQYTRANGYYYPLSGSGSLHSYGTAGTLRPMKYLGDGNITQFISLRFDHYLNSYSGGRTRLQVYWDNDGTWTLISDSGDIYGAYPSYTERSLGLPQGQTTLKFVARVGLGQWDQAGIRIYKNKGAFNLSNVNLTSEGTNTYSESTDYYQFQTQAEPGVWKDAVMYATYS